MSRGLERGLVLGLLVGASVLFFSLTRSERPEHPPSPSPTVPDQWLGQRMTALGIGAGGVVLAGDEAGQLSIYAGDDASGWRRIARHTLHAGPIRTVRQERAGVFTVSADGSAAIWTGPWLDLQRKMRLRAPGGLRLNDGVLTADGADVVVTTERGMVARLSKNGVVWKHPGAHGRAGFAVALGVDGVVWSVGADGWIRGWGLDGASVSARQITDRWLTGLVVLDDRVVVVGDEGRVERYDSAGKLELRYGDGAGRVTAVAAAGAWLAVGDTDGRIRLYDVESGAAGPAVRGPPGAVFALAFDGLVLCSSGGDDAVRRWRVTDGQLLATLR